MFVFTFQFHNTHAHTAHRPYKLKQTHDALREHLTMWLCKYYICESEQKRTWLRSICCLIRFFACSTCSGMVRWLPRSIVGARHAKIEFIFGLLRANIRLIDSIFAFKRHVALTMRALSLARYAARFCVFSAIVCVASPPTGAISNGSIEANWFSKWCVENEHKENWKIALPRSLSWVDGRTNRPI